MDPLAFHYSQNGIHLPHLRLRLDSRRVTPPHELAFVSHAHADHVANHHHAALNEATARFLRLRYRNCRRQTVIPFHQPTAFDPLPSGPPAPKETATSTFELTLLPAGHMLGSAMAFIQTAGRSLLYTGDFQLAPSPAAERCDPTPARQPDILLMETTFGLPKYIFPPRRQVLDQIIRFCQETLSTDANPVLLTYSLGKSQMLLAALRHAGMPCMLHPDTYRATCLYDAMGIRFPPYSKWDEHRRSGKVLILPPAADRDQWLSGCPRIRTAAVTGWAMERSCKYQYGVDTAFPLSDHADFADLIRFVQSVRPKKVFTLHGFAAEFAQTLRELGYDASALGGPEQLHLPLGLTQRAALQKDHGFRIGDDRSTDTPVKS